MLPNPLWLLPTAPQALRPVEAQIACMHACIHLYNIGRSLARAGIFIPLLGTGAALGRLVGMAVQGALSHANSQLTISLPAYAARTILLLLLCLASR
jgi:H+/Cl- antiporter ClcA